MKKCIFILTAIIFTTLVFSSCKKMRCTCVAQGYVSEATVNAALSKHINDCVSIADNEDNGELYDPEYNVTVTCSY